MYLVVGLPEKENGRKKKPKNKPDVAKKEWLFDGPCRQSSFAISNAVCCRFVV